MKPDAPVDAELHVVEVPLDGRPQPLSYSETGAGRPVVALHGFPASSRDFRWLDAALQERVRLFRLDLPGFGRSPAPERDRGDFALLGRAVRAFLDTLALDEVILLGHSMGGGVAVEAARLSRRVAGVVLVNSCGPMQHRGNFPRAYRVVTALGDLHPRVERALVAALKPVARAMGFSKHIPDDQLVRAGRVAMAYAPARFAAQLRALDTPVLVAWATRDPSVQPAVSQATLACARRGASLRIDAKTHNLQATHAVELADALLAWLEKGPHRWTGAGA